MKEWNGQKLPKVLLGCSGGRLPGTEEEEEDENSNEKKVRYEIAHEVVAGIKEKAGAKSTAQGHAVKVSSKVGTARKYQTKKRKEEEDWQKEDQMEVQWAKDETLEESLERRRDGKFPAGGSHAKKYMRVNGA